MATDHESKLFITRTTFRSGLVTHQVHRTRAAARRYAKDRMSRGTVNSCTVLPAKWGPDA